MAAGIARRLLAYRWRSHRQESQDEQTNHQSRSSRNGGLESNYKPPKMIQQPEAGPASEEQLVVEIKSFYALLAIVESQCIAVDNARASNTDTSTYNEKCPSARGQKLASKPSLHSHARRRVNRRLLPLPRCEQDVESLKQWLPISKQSSSLLDLFSRNASAFGHQGEDLQEALDQVEAVLARLQMASTRKDDELSRKKGLKELVFEFPNNFWDVCTTIVHRGVRWISLSRSRDNVPAIQSAPDDPNLGLMRRPAAQGFQLASTGTGVHGNYVMDIAISDTIQSPPSHHTWKGTRALVGDGNSWYPDFEVMDSVLDPIGLSQATPQDPNFLTMGVAASGEPDGLLLSNENFSRLAETLWSSSFPNPLPHTSHRVEQQARAGPEIDFLSTTNRDEEPSSINLFNVNQQGQDQPLHKCPDCDKTFTRPFTLNRHRTETHLTIERAPEEVLTCPNPGCKRSNDQFAFKRSDHLKRHVKNCKHKQDTPSSQPEGESARSTTASPGNLGSSEDSAPLQGETVDANRGAKRPRLGNEDGESSDDQLLKGMLKKYKRMSKVAEEKKRAYLQAEKDLEAVAATIRILRKKGDEGDGLST